MSDEGGVLKKLYEILLTAKFQTLLTITGVLASGGLFGIGEERYGAAFLGGTLLAVLMYSMYSVWVERRMLELEHFREPLFIDFHSLQERIYLDARPRKPPLSVDSTEIYVFRNRSKHHDIRELGNRLEYWIYPDSSVEIKSVETVDREEIRKLGYATDLETHLIPRPFTSPVISDFQKDKWRIVFCPIEFGDPLKPGETIGIKVMLNCLSFFDMEDYYIYEPDFATARARLEFVAPAGYCILLKRFSVHDAGRRIVPSAVDELELRGETPRENAVKSNLTWEISNPVLLYGYRIDFRVQPST